MFVQLAAPSSTRLVVTVDSRDLRVDDTFELSGNADCRYLPSEVDGGISAATTVGARPGAFPQTVVGYRGMGAVYKRMGTDGGIVQTEPYTGL